MNSNTIMKMGFDKIMVRENKERALFILKLIVFLALVYLQVEYPQFEESFNLPLWIIKPILFFITANLVISFSRLLLVYLYIKKNRRQIDFKDNFIIGINQIASLLSSFAFFISLFLLLKIDILKFFTSISIAAAAFALLSKDYISNMINGMIIMFTDQLSLNDDVKIGDQKGKIVDITLINLHLLNDNEDLVYIPNNTVFTTNVINYTKYNINKITIDFELNRDQLRTLSELEEYLYNSLRSYANLIQKNSLHIRVSKITKDYAQLKLQFVLLNQTKDEEDEIKDQVYRNILRYISENKEENKV